MTNTTNTATRPYAFHANCDHEGTKQARRRCRVNTRRALEATKVTELRTIARSVDLENRSKVRKDEMVYRLSFAPAVREAYAA